MVGMFLPGWIKMISCILKLMRAVPVFMNMHAIELRGLRSIDIGQVKDFCFHQNTSILRLVEINNTT